MSRDAPQNISSHQNHIRFPENAAPKNCSRTINREVPEEGKKHIEDQTAPLSGAIQLTVRRLDKK